LLANRDEKSILYRGPSKDASYQISVHLKKRCKRRIFFLEINQLETGIACGSHVIEDLPYIVPTKLRFIWLSSFRKEDFV
jgi:hypothetical protein